MGKNNTSGRGFSSASMRKFREESYKKTLNRQKNQAACTKNNIIKDEKSRLWQIQQTEK